MDSPKNPEAKKQEPNVKAHLLASTGPPYPTIQSLRIKGKGPRYKGAFQNWGDSFGIVSRELQARYIANARKLRALAVLAQIVWDIVGLGPKLHGI